ncbi:MAG: hypothetical protein AAGK79_20115 [Pseudomonadota bacterium]
MRSSGNCTDKSRGTNRRISRTTMAPVKSYQRQKSASGTSSSATRSTEICNVRAICEVANSSAVSPLSSIRRNSRETEFVIWLVTPSKWRCTKTTDTTSNTEITGKSRIKIARP